MELHIWRPGEREYVGEVKVQQRSKNLIKLFGVARKESIRIQSVLVEDDLQNPSDGQSEPILADIIWEDGIRERGRMRRFKGAIDIVLVE